MVVPELGFRCCCRSQVWRMGELDLAARQVASCRGQVQRQGLEVGHEPRRLALNKPTEISNANVCDCKLPALGLRLRASFSLRPRAPAHPITNVDEFQTVCNSKRVRFGVWRIFFCACLTIGFAQLCGCFAARKEEIRKHCSELGGPQTRTIKHNGRVRNHSLPGLVVSLDLAVLGGQAQNGGEVLL